MLMQDYKEWIHKPSNLKHFKKGREDAFPYFMQEYLQKVTDKHETNAEIFREVVTDLAKQVYHLQICVEGLIEDTL